MNKYSGRTFNVGLSDFKNLSKQQLVKKLKNMYQICNFYSDYYQDPDKRDYIVSNEKIENTGWKPNIH